MTQEILPIPDIPRTLLIAAEMRTLVPFIGAGVSRLADGPDWEEFANKAFEPFIQANKFTHAARELLQKYPARTRLSIAASLQDSVTGISYSSILHPANNQSHPVGRAIYGHLGKLSKVWVTTNYDSWPEFVLPDPILQSTPDVSAISTDPLKRTRYFHPKDFKPEYLDNDHTVFHLHGCILDEPRMVLTTRNYLEHYSSKVTDAGEQNQTLTFLKYLFAVRNLLFVGYSLRELEILEYIVQKSTTSRDSETGPRHFILLPFYSHEISIVSHLKKYFLDLGVGLLPYRIDETGYRQLTNVIAHYAEALQPIGAAAIRDIEDLMELLDD